MNTTRSDAEKVDILERWEYEEQQIAVAVDEGMPGPDPLLLGRVVAARVAFREDGA